MKNKKIREVLSPLPQLSISVLNSDLATLADTVKKLTSVGIRVIHLDIMDGNFVPNISFGSSVVKSLRKHTKSFFDVHLMINSPQKMYIEYINAGADLIVFHYESIPKIQIKNLIHKIKINNTFCGISIKPDTDVDEIIPYLDMIDIVLIMTVEPGFGGQRMLPKCLSKIFTLNKYREQKKLDFLISCDGGINERNIVEVIKLGCELPVVGSAIFNSKNFVEKTKFFYLLTKQIKFDKFYQNKFNI